MYILKALEDKFMCTVCMQIVQKPDGRAVLKVLSRLVAHVRLWGEEVGAGFTFLRR